MAHDIEPSVDAWGSQAGRMWGCAGGRKGFKRGRLNQQRTTRTGIWRGYGGDCFVARPAFRPAPRNDANCISPAMPTLYSVAMQGERVLPDAPCGPIFSLRPLRLHCALCGSVFSPYALCPPCLRSILHLVAEADLFQKETVKAETPGPVPPADNEQPTTNNELL
jgi:hypothetical protein